MTVVTVTERPGVTVEVTDGRLTLVQLSRQLLDRAQTDPDVAAQLVATTIGRALDENSAAFWRQLPPPGHPYARQLHDRFVQTLTQPPAEPSVQGRVADTAAVQVEASPGLRTVVVPDFLLAPEHRAELERALVSTVNSQLAAAAQAVHDELEPVFAGQPTIDWDDVERNLDAPDTRRFLR